MPNRLTKGRGLFNAVDAIQYFQGGTAIYPAGGTATGLKLSSGTVSLTASTAVPTGLNTVASFQATIRGTAAPGTAGPIILTAGTASGGTVTIYGWKYTGTADSTLIAATGTATVCWQATGS